MKIEAMNLMCASGTFSIGFTYTHTDTNGYIRPSPTKYFIYLSINKKTYLVSKFDFSLINQDFSKLI